MVSTNGLQTLDRETEIFVPFPHYSAALSFVLTGKNADIALMPTQFVDGKDMTERLEWTERFRHLSETCHISSRNMMRFRTHFDPNELFNLLVDALKNDKDTQNYIDYHFNITNYQNSD